MEILGKPTSTLQIRFRAGTELDLYSFLDSNGPLELEKSYEFEEVVESEFESGDAAPLSYRDGKYPANGMEINGLDLGNVGILATGRGTTDEIRSFVKDLVSRLQNLGALPHGEDSPDFHEFPSTELRVQLSGETDRLVSDELQSLIEKVGRGFEGDRFDVDVNIGLFGFGFERTFSGQMADSIDSEELQEMNALLTPRTIILGSPGPADFGEGEFRVSGGLPDDELAEFVSEIEEIMSGS